MIYDICWVQPPPTNSGIMDLHITTLKKKHHKIQSKFWKKFGPSITFHFFFHVNLARTDFEKKGPPMFLNLPGPKNPTQEPKSSVWPKKFQGLGIWASFQFMRQNHCIVGIQIKLPDQKLSATKLPHQSLGPTLPPKIQAQIKTNKQIYVNHSPSSFPSSISPISPSFFHFSFPLLPFSFHLPSQFLSPLSIFHLSPLSLSHSLGPPLSHPQPILSPPYFFSLSFFHIPQLPHLILSTLSLLLFSSPFVPFPSFFTSSFTCLKKC